MDPFRGPLDCLRGAVEHVSGDVGVDLAGGAAVGVPRELLSDTLVHSLLSEHGDESVAQVMDSTVLHSCRLDDAGPAAMSVALMDGPAGAGAQDQVVVLPHHRLGALALLVRAVCVEQLRDRG